MRPLAWYLFVGCSTALAAGLGPQDGAKSSRPALDMSKAVICKKVVGYEDFVEQPDATLTSDDKLNIYYRPLNFHVDGVDKPRPGSRFKAQFSQDCRIRRKGEKTILQKKDKIVEYSPTFETPLERLYILTNISLKGLPPGEYELDVILHDELAMDATAKQTVGFAIVPIETTPAPTKDAKAAEPASPPAPEKTPKKARKTARAKP